MNVQESIKSKIIQILQNGNPDQIYSLIASGDTSLFSDILYQEAKDRDLQCSCGKLITQEQITTAIKAYNLNYTQIGTALFVGDNDYLSSQLKLIYDDLCNQICNSINGNGTNTNTPPVTQNPTVPGEVNNTQASNVSKRTKSLFFAGAVAAFLLWKFS